MPALESGRTPTEDALESLAGLRGPVTRRLLNLDQRGELRAAHVRVTAEALGMSDRTLWRWLRQARRDGRCVRKERERFVLTEELQARLALLGGNVSRLHRELKAEHRQGGPAVPSLRTLYRAVERDLSRGEVAGIRRGERARREFDVYLQRAQSKHLHRNQVWEADHVEIPVQVDVEGRLRKPWVTWFIDCGTKAICGLAITMGPPNRASVLVAARSAVVCDDRNIPFGGLPTMVRVDRGKDFLSKAVQTALGRLAVPVVPMPGRHPHLKGTVEELNHAVEEMFCKSLPRYTHGPTPLSGRPVDPDAPALTFEGFVHKLLEWVAEWNCDLPKPVLGNRTPEQAWLEDPWPVDEVAAEDLALYMLEDDGRTRVITKKGLRWRNRHYVDDWMEAGMRVTLRYMPHHDHRIEVFDASTGAHLGAGFLADESDPELTERVTAARRAKEDKVAKTLKAAAKLRRERYAPVTVAQPLQRLGRLTVDEAERELREADPTDLRPLDVPRLFPLPEPDPGWVVPGTVVPDAARQERRSEDGSGSAEPGHGTS